MQDNKPHILDFGEPEKENSIIKVIGVGGGGGNAVNHMYREGIHDVSFVFAIPTTKPSTILPCQCICNWVKKDSELATNQKRLSKLPKKPLTTSSTC